MMNLKSTVDTAHATSVPAIILHQKVAQIFSLLVIIFIFILFVVNYYLDVRSNCWRCQKTLGMNRIHVAEEHCQLTSPSNILDQDLGCSVYIVSEHILVTITHSLVMIL